MNRSSPLFIPFIKLSIGNKCWILDGIQVRDRYHCESQLLLRLVRELEVYERKQKVSSWFGIFFYNAQYAHFGLFWAGNEIMTRRRSNVLMTRLLAVVFWGCKMIVFITNRKNINLDT